MKVYNLVFVDLDEGEPRIFCTSKSFDTARELLLKEYCCRLEGEEKLGSVEFTRLNETSAIIMLYNCGALVWEIIESEVID